MCASLALVRTVLALDVEDVVEVEDVIEEVFEVTDD